MKELVKVVVQKIKYEYAEKVDSLRLEINDINYVQLPPMKNTLSLYQDHIKNSEYLQSMQQNIKQLL